MPYKIGYNPDKKRMITIDPGINTGVVLWNYGMAFHYEVLKGTYYEIAESLNTLLEEYEKPDFYFDCAIVEGVDIRTTSEISLAAASRGNLSTLAYTVGAIAYICRTHCLDVNIVRFIEWAGQLSYKQLRIILQKKFNFSAPNDHIAAAHGIGLWAKGLL